MTNKPGTIAGIKKTTSAIDEKARTAKEYQDALAKYNSMAPDKKNLAYADVVKLYNQAAVAHNFAIDRRIESYQRPNLNYQAEQYQNPDQPAPDKAAPAPEYRPPNVEGEKPMEQFYTGAQNLLKKNNLGWLGGVFGILKKLESILPTEVQAFQLDIARDLIGWGVEQNKELSDPNKTVWSKALNIGNVFSGGYAGIIGSSVMSPFNALSKYGAHAVAQTEMSARILGNEINNGVGYATPTEMKATARERYEMGKMSGTLDPLSSGIFDIGKSMIQNWGQMSSEQWNNIGSGKYQHSFALLPELISRTYKDSAAAFAMDDKQRPAIEAEFVRRMRNGESPDALALELSDPMKELLASVIYDPTNVIGFLTSPISKAKKVRDLKNSMNIAEDLKSAGKLKEASRLMEIIDSVNARKIDAAMMEDFSKITDAYRTSTSAGAEASRLGKLGVRIPFTQKVVEIGGIPGRIFSKVSNAHVNDAMQGLTSIASGILKDLRNVGDDVAKGDRAATIMQALARFWSGPGSDPAAYRRAGELLAESPSAMNFLSKDGAKTGEVLAHMLLAEDGSMDLQKINRLKAIITDAKPGAWGGDMRVATALEPWVEDIFPTVGRRLEFEQMAVDAQMALDAGPSKRITTMQEQVAKYEKDFAILRDKIKPTASQAMEWAQDPSKAPKDFKKMQDLAQSISSAKATIKQSTEIPRNLKYWSANPVSQWEKLGWNILEGKEKIYHTFMPMMNKVYISWNPGQWGRNFITNEMHLMYDSGLTGALVTPQKAQEMAHFRGSQGLLPDIAFGGYAKSGEQILGQEGRLFGKNIANDVETLAHAQRGVTSVQNSVDKLVSRLAREDTLLKEMGIPEDKIRELWGHVNGKFDAQAAIDDLLNGKGPSSLSYISMENAADRKLAQSVGIDQKVDAYILKGDYSDEATAALKKEIQGAVDESKAIPLSIGPEDYADNSLIQAHVDDTRRAIQNGEQVNPDILHGKTYYHAQDTIMTKTMGGAERTGERLLANVPDSHGARTHLRNLFETSEEEVQKSIARARKVRDEASDLLNATDKSKKISWMEYHSKVKGAMEAEEDIQFAARLQNLKDMNNFLLQNGVDPKAVTKWHSELQTALDRAADYYGDGVTVRHWTSEQFKLFGGYKYAGENGSQVLNAFAARGIPLVTSPGDIHAGYFDQLGRNYSWVSIQGQLENAGLDPNIWTVKKIAGNDFTPGELAELNKALDAIAAGQPSIVTRAGITHGNTWTPSRDWQEAPKFMTGELPNVVVPAEQVASGETAFMKVRQKSGAPIRGTAIPWDDAKIPDTVYHTTTNMSGVEKTGMLKAKGAGGLGGDAKDAIVSMTIDKAIAEQLSNDMKFTRNLADQFGSVQAGSNRSEWADGLISALQEQARKEGWEWATPSGNRESYDFMDWVKSFYTKREWEKPELRNPVFMGSVEDMLKIDPKNIGVIEIPRANLNTGALITDFDLKSSTGLKEIRMYGDVPIKSSGGFDTAFYETRVENGKTVVRLKDGLGDGQIKVLERKAILDQIGLEPQNAKLRDELKSLHELDEAAAPVGGVPSEKKLPILQQRLADKAAADASLKRQNRIAEIEAEFMRQYDEKSTIMVPHDQSPPTSHKASYAPQETDINRITDYLITQAKNDAAKPKPTGAWYTKEQEAALRTQWAEQVGQKLTDMRPVIRATAQADIDFSLLNYSQRRGFDTLFSFVFPYHYWYSRTYTNWMQRIIKNPAVLGAYSRYRSTMARIHADAPDWYKYNVNTNELFGMDSDSPLYFNLEATFNPLNGLTGVDFSDPDKAKTWYGALIQDVGKWGPSIQTPILLLVGLAEIIRGDRQVETGKDLNGNPVYEIQTGQEAAEGYLGRLIPQTGTVKALSSAAGSIAERLGASKETIRGLVDPGSLIGLSQGMGGLELDPMVLAMGGMSKYERRGVERVISQFEANGKLPDGTPFTHEQAIEAEYSQKGPIWEMAAKMYNSQRAPGRLLAAIGGPGFQSRPKTDMYIDQFYKEMNDLYNQKSTKYAGPEGAIAWRQAMDNLNVKYPYATSLMMARKSGLARDEALVYDILKRIPPGQTTEFADMVGLSNELIDYFYSQKGLTNQDGRPNMNDADMQQFMGGIKQLGAILAMPPTATRNEWNAAKLQYSKAFSMFDETTMQNVDMYFTIRSKDSNFGEQYLAQHPEVQQYFAYRDQTIMKDALLFRYYGGINFLDSFYQRDMAAHALETWPDIDKIAFAYDQVKANGGDTKGFLKDYPQLSEYWKYVSVERSKIKGQLNELSSKIPEVPAFWRSDNGQMGVIAKQAMENRTQSNPAVPIDSMALPYIGEGEKVSATGAGFDLSTFLSGEAEKLWPGMKESYSAYKTLLAKNAKLASAYLLEHPDVSEYIAWDKKLRNAYNRSIKAQKTATPVEATWNDWAGVFNDSTRRLLENYFATGKLSASVRSSLTRTLAKAGIYDVDGWLSQMSKSMGA
jgi:hypothetical protein